MVNSLLNWPIQAHGSEILRYALIELNKNHFEVNCPVHDAFLISIPTVEFESRLEDYQLNEVLKSKGIGIKT